MAEKSKVIFYRMWLFNCGPLFRALSTLLNLLVESRCLDLAEEVFVDLRNLRLVPNACIFIISIKFHCEAENFEKGLEILEEMDRVKCAPNVISYSTLMGGLFRVGKLKEVVGVFEEMLKKANCS